MAKFNDKPLELTVECPGEIFELEGRVTKVVDYLLETEQNLIKTGHRNVRMAIEYEYETAVLRFYADRDETPAEVAVRKKNFDRIEKNKNSVKAKTDAEERRIYERLKKKFEGK